MPAPPRVNNYARAFRAWPILTAAAADRTVVTYAALAGALEIHPRPIRYVLEPIQNWCLEQAKPPLTILVVNNLGRPGQGFIAWERDNLDEGRQQVYEFPWELLANPFEFAADGITTPEALGVRVVAAPEEAAEVYALVRDRGIGQRVFRLALLDVYRGRCAFCGLSLATALRAAHLIPWGQATPADRVAPSNGLLLCSTHHDLFDAGILSVAPDFTVVCRDEHVRGHPRTAADRRAASELHGRAISLPAAEWHRPSNHALSYLANHPRP